MALKHRITINVTDPHGKTGTVLKGADARLPARLARFLFGGYTQVYLLKPGQTVEFGGCQRSQRRKRQWEK